MPRKQPNLAIADLDEETLEAVGNALAARQEVSQISMWSMVAEIDLLKYAYAMETEEPYTPLDDPASATSVILDLAMMSEASRGAIEHFAHHQDHRSVMGAVSAFNKIVETRSKIGGFLKDGMGNDNGFDAGVLREIAIDIATPLRRHPELLEAVHDTIVARIPQEDASLPR